MALVFAGPMKTGPLETRYGRTFAPGQNTVHAIRLGFVRRNELITLVDGTVTIGVKNLLGRVRAEQRIHQDVVAVRAGGLTGTRLAASRNRVEERKSANQLGREDNALPAGQR